MGFYGNIIKHFQEAFSSFSFRNSDKSKVDISANNTKEGLILTSANKWIKFSGGDEEANSFSIGIEHNVPDSNGKNQITAIEVNNTNKEQKFCDMSKDEGAIINIEECCYDELGHINNGQKISSTIKLNINSHKQNQNNPHKVTKSQVGLGNVDNKSEMTIKQDFTGKIISGNQNFVKGGEVFDELAKKLNINDLDINDKVKSNEFVTGISAQDNQFTISRRKLVPDDVPILTVSKISDFNQKVTDKINLLDVAQVITQNGQIINSIKQTDGKISTTLKNLNEIDIPALHSSKISNFNESVEQHSTVSALKATVGNSSNGLVKDVKELQEKSKQLVGAMHFIGSGAALPDPTQPYKGKALNDGDVFVINSGKLSGKEYVYSSKQWVELGDTSVEQNRLTVLEDSVNNEKTGIKNTTHFKGELNSIPKDTSNYVNGDIILVGEAEYILSNSKWKEFGTAATEEGLIPIQATIEANKQNISKNATAIEANKQNISKNATAIEANKQNIFTNSADIKANTQNISRNTNSINNLAITGTISSANILQIHFNGK